MPRSVNINVPVPTWKSGFARHASGSRYPGLWKGLQFQGDFGLGNTGDTLRDVSGRKNSGTWAGAGPQHWSINDGRMAGEFDGNDDYVQIPASSLWTLSSASVFFWINYRTWGATSSSNEWNAPVDTFGDNASHEFSFEADTDSSNDLYVKMNASATSVLVKSGMNAEVGNWRLIGMTYDGATIRTYYGGKETATASASFTIDASSGFRIGGGRSAFDVQMDGFIDSFSVHNRALSPSEIQTLDQIGRGGILQRKPYVIAKASAAAAGGIVGSIFRSPVIRAA